MGGRSKRQSMWRGFLRTCPACGKGNLFQTYLTTLETCSHCGEALHHHRADDAPPYFTIFAVGHIIIPLFVAVEKVWHPELWVHFALWIPATTTLSVWLLPRIKGTVIGLQWALGMHGFSKDKEP